MREDVSTVFCTCIVYGGCPQSFIQVNYRRVDLTEFRFLCFITCRVRREVCSLLLAGVTVNRRSSVAVTHLVTS